MAPIKMAAWSKYMAGEYGEKSEGVGHGPHSVLHCLVLFILLTSHIGNLLRSAVAKS